MISVAAPVIVVTELALIVPVVAVSNVLRSLALIVVSLRVIALGIAANFVIKASAIPLLLSPSRSPRVYPAT